MTAEAPVEPRTAPAGPGPGLPGLDRVTAEYLAAHPDDCAATVLTAGQKVRYALLGLLLLAGVVYWYVAIDVLNFLVCALYGLIIFYKLFTVLLAAARRREIQVSPGELAALGDGDLPVYTILVPMYKEGAVAPKLLRAVGCLDYPADKLDVKLLLEADDLATQAACRELALPFPVETIVVPEGRPKTKPRACNWGLAAARGEYLVVFDAEDRPEPDQLKKAVVAFRQQPPEVVCLQAKLNYYNPRQNWLTRFFTLEYTAWFDLYLPGLHALNVPIPLGGTSNHFRTAALRALGGWDPFNVTEDCDLGVRLERAGCRTRILESTTWEEANSRLGNWLRQRSRWVKGYIQTHLVHTRQRLATARAMGLKNYLSFLLTIGGLPAVLLLNPLYWIIGLAYLGMVLSSGHGWQMWYDSAASDIDELRGLGNIYATFWRALTGQEGVSFSDLLRIPWGNYPSQIFFPITVALLVSNVFLIAVHVIACGRRKLWDLAPWALFIPVYWVLISIGAWKGFLQLLTRPFHWEKTVHGLTATEPPECGSGQLDAPRGTVEAGFKPAPAAPGGAGPGPTEAPPAGPAPPAPEDSAAAGSPSARRRKQRSEALLLAAEVPVNAHLPLVEDEEEARIRTPAETARRAVCLYAFICAAHGRSRAEVKGWLQSEELWHFLSPRELAYLENPAPETQATVDATWRIEALNALLWALGHIGELPWPRGCCDVPGIQAIMPRVGESAREFLAGARLRPAGRILDETDFIYRAHWAVVNARLGRRTPPGGLTPGVVYERHYALNWLTCYADEWDKVTTDT